MFPTGDTYTRPASTAAIRISSLAESPLIAARIAFSAHQNNSSDYAVENSAMSRLASLSHSAGAASKSRMGTSKGLERTVIQEEMLDEEYGGVQYNSKIQELEASLQAERAKLGKMQEDLKKARQERTAQAQLTVANKHGQMLQGMTIGMSAIQQKQEQEKVKWEEEWRFKLQDLWQQQHKAMADFKARVDSELRAIQAEMVGNIRRRAQKAAENGGRLSPRTISKTQQDNVRVLVKLFSKHSQEKLMITNKFSRLEEALLHQRSQSQQKFAQRMHKAQQALCGRMARYASNATGAGQLLLQPPTFDSQGAYGAETVDYSSYDQRPAQTFNNYQDGSDYTGSSGGQFMQQTGPRNEFKEPMQNRTLHSNPNPSSEFARGGQMLSPLMRSSSQTESVVSNHYDPKRPVTMPASNFKEVSTQDNSNSSFFLTQFASEGNPLGNQADILREDELYSHQQYGYDTSFAPSKASKTSSFADNSRASTSESFMNKLPTSVENVYAPFSASQRPGSSIVQDSLMGQQQRPGSSVAFQDQFMGMRPGSSLPPAMLRPGTSNAGFGFPSTPGSSGQMGEGFGSFNGTSSGFNQYGYDQGGPQLEMPPPPTWSTSVISFAQPAAAPPTLKKEKPMPSPYEIPQQIKGAKPVAKKAQELLRTKTPAGAGVNVVKDREKLSQKVEVAPEDFTSKQVLGEVTSKDPKELSSNLKEVTSASKDDPSKQKKVATKVKNESGVANKTSSSAAYSNSATEASRFEELERWIDSKIDRAMKVQETPLVAVGQLGEKVPQTNTPQKPLTAARVLGVADEEANSPSVVSALLSRLRSTMKTEGNRDEMAAKDLNYIIPPPDRDGLKGISIITSSERSQQLAKSEVKEVPQSLHTSTVLADDRLATKEKRSSHAKMTKDSLTKEASTTQTSGLQVNGKYAAKDDDHSQDEDSPYEQGDRYEEMKTASAVGFSFDSSSENLLSAAMAQSGADQNESHDSTGTKMRRQDLDAPPGKLDPLVVNDRRAELRALELKTSASVKHAIAPDDDDDDESPRNGGKRPGTSSSVSVKDLNADLSQNIGEGEDLLQVLFRKIRHNKVADVEPVVKAIGNVDERDEHGNSPLMVACQNGHKRISKLLLDMGAGINVQNHRGNTALHFASAYGYSSLAKWLIEKGADDSIMNFSGLTCYDGVG